MKNLICSQCGNETQYNFGPDHKIPICRNCAKKEEIKLKKERDSVKNSVANILNIFSWVIFAISILASLNSFSKMDISLGLSLFVSGIILSLLFAGLSEIIIQLSMLNKKMQKE